jgi:hypothetical protein
MDYKVRFGKTARTIVYEDAAGEICFTFDFANEHTIILEEPPQLGSDGELDRIRKAAARTKKFLTKCGYAVETSLL